jgi:hypothetical protein
MKPTRLCSHNKTVHAINTDELDALCGDVEMYVAKDETSDSKYQSLLDNMRVAPTLHLKIGAQVQLTIALY